MTPRELTEKITALSSEQQDAVEKFIVFLQEKKTTNARAAIDAFMNEHAELMRLVAQ